MKRVCDFINGHEDFISITAFVEYKMAMKPARVIREAYNTKKKRMQNSHNKRSDEANPRAQ